MNTYALLIGLVIAVLFVVSYFGFLFSTRIFGIKTTVKSLLLPAATICISGLAAQLIQQIAEDRTLSTLIWLLFLGGGLYIWHVLLSRNHATTFAKSTGSYIVGGIISMVLSTVLALMLLNFLRVYEINGSAMSPAYNDSDRVLVWKLAQKWGRHDTVVYHYTIITDDRDNPRTGQTVGRILGLPGETVTPDRTYFGSDGFSRETASYQLKDNEYYITGDNKGASFGAIVTPDKIVGKVGPIITKAE